MAPVGNNLQVHTIYRDFSKVLAITLSASAEQISSRTIDQRSCWNGGRGGGDLEVIQFCFASLVSPKTRQYA
ncbi:hypothetical protein GWI33_009447 [Rhynchophorus ferrugineus]|uniref:Uncharacterized protein n=2 Tax=Rhynchophorus ferrugineus TaxID=354439 RepID=A0A834I9R5_RHYFE|nr:hypothetical protein GWI33_009447 [Rhynchophorus ferrugineus]